MPICACDKKAPSAGAKKNYPGGNPVAESMIQASYDTGFLGSQYAKEEKKCYFACVERGK